MSNNGNPYRPIEAEVLDVITETATIKTLHMKPKEVVTFKPGQFIELTVPGVGEAPFTPSSRWLIEDTLDVSVMRVGRVTQRIHELVPGDTVGVRGPFGSGYPIDTFKGRELLVVGGGCGFAPLRSLMYALFEYSKQFKKLIFRGGCKTNKDLLYSEEMKGWAKRDDLDFQLTVDKGDEDWDGHVGVVTTILEDLPMNCEGGIAIVCGPPIMMKFATLKLLKMGFREDSLYLSMEKNMSCGIGKCGHCRLGTYYCCKDGPVFTYSQIKNFDGIWD